MIRKNSLTVGNALNTMQNIPDDYVDCIIVDPPYKILQRAFEVRSNKWKPSIVEFTVFEPFYTKFFDQCNRILKKDRSLFVFCNDQSYPFFFACCFGIWDYKKQIVWSKTKTHFTLGTGLPFRKIHENILHCYNANPFFIKEHRQSVLECPTVPIGDRTHPAQKPEELLVQLILAVTQDGDTVLDPMCGTGSTLIASKKISRNYIGIDLNPEFIDVAIKELELVVPIIKIKNLKKLFRRKKYD